MIEKRPQLSLIIALMLFGTIGTVSRFVDLPSAFLSCIRAFISTAVIVSYLYAGKRPPNLKAIKANSALLLFAGLFQSINWVLMFEAFRHTTVAVASLCYYMQPIFLMFSAPFFFGEKLPLRKIICILIAFFGLIMVTDLYAFSEVFTGSASGSTGTVLSEHYKGVLFALLSAVMYTGCVIVNKKFKEDINPIDSTCAQIFLAGIILTPYVFLTTEPSSLRFDARNVVLLLILSVLHTGIAYIIYYASARCLKAQTIAVLSYIDPVESVLLSVFFLREPMTVNTLIGAFLILGATYIGARE